MAWPYAFTSLFKREKQSSAWPPVLGCTPQACKPYTCQASRLKREPGVSSRDISGLLDGGSYPSDARSWSDFPLFAAASGQDTVAVFTSRERIPVIGGIDIRLAHGLPGKLAEGHAPYHLFVKLSGGDVLI